ncbi:hypothetical protein RhiirA4_481340, partial [Rhizophagus irregularis]
KSISVNNSLYLLLKPKYEALTAPIISCKLLHSVCYSRLLIDNISVDNLFDRDKLFKILTKTSPTSSYKFKIWNLSKPT